LNAHQSKILNDSILELLLLIGRVGVIETEKESAVVLLMREIIVEKGGLGVTNVEISRRLRGESSDDTVLGTLEGNVVAGTLLGLGVLLLLSSSVHRLHSSVGPGAELLDKPVPASEVNERSLLQRSNGDTVAAEGTPNGKVGGGQRVSDDEGAKQQVGVNALEDRIKGLEIKGSEGVQLREPFGFLETS
jgi:hypothetical protein